jgi:hypothetical protein
MLMIVGGREIELRERKERKKSTKFKRADFAPSSTQDKTNFTPNVVLNRSLRECFLPLGSAQGKISLPPMHDT